MPEVQKHGGGAHYGVVLCEDRQKKLIEATAYCSTDGPRLPFALRQSRATARKALRFDRSLADPDLERPRFFIQVFPGQLSGGSPFQLPAQRHGIVIVSDSEGSVERKIFPSLEDQLMPDRSGQFAKIEQE